MPTNSATSSPTIHVSVVRALRHSVGLNTGTALEIASMPVIAVEPEEKARRISSTPTPSVAVSGGLGVAWKLWPAASIRPTAISTNIARMNAYVGAANSEPAWRTPRRLPASRTMITATPIATLSGASDGIAEVTASSPDATDTATVRM